MSYFDKYVKRTTVDGTSESDVYNNATIEFVNKTFTQSASYRQAMLNGVTPIDVRVVKGKKIDDSRDKSVIFRPQTKTPIGSYLTFDNQTWLLMDSDYIHPIVPKGTIMLCNSTLRWIDKNGVQHSTLCVATSNVQPRLRSSILQDKENVNSVHDGIGIYLPNNSEVKTINYTTRFILNGSAYQVYGIDNLSNVTEGVEGGIVELLTRLDNIQPTDDTTQGIASVKTDQKPSSGGDTAW